MARSFAKHRMRGSRQLSERRSAPASRCGGADADPKQQSRRDLRLDLFRGLSLLVIFIDHIPNNVLSYVTLHSIAFSDAAEVFIFISGYAAATVYGRALRRQGGIAATGQIYRRIWQLYVAHIFIFVILAAEVCYQFLFVIGATAGYSRYSPRVFPVQSSWLPKLAILITVAFGIVSISWTIHGAYDAFPGLLLRELSPLVEDKSNVAPLRLVSFVALAVTTAHFVGHNSRLLRWRVAQLIIRCGQHSLQVFCLGIVLSVLGSILVTFRDDILMQLAIDFGGIVLMVGTAALLTWYKASNATHADAVVAASGNFETRRRKVVGIERHVIVWAQGLGRMWGRSKRGRTEVRWRSHPYPTA